MIKVNVHDKDAQLVVLNTLYPDSGIKVRIEGELELYDITEALVVELFKNLLHKNLVSEVTFSYVEEKKEPAGDEEAQSKEPETPQRGDSSEAAEEDETKKLSESEKRDIMQHLFLNEDYEDVLKYIFSTKNKFVVKLAQKKFAGPRAQQLSDVITALNKAEVIVFNDDFSEGGSYEISASWRIWAYLFRAKREVASKTIEVDLQMKPSEFNAGIKEALEKGIVKKEVDEKLKITTYCVA